MFTLGAHVFAQQVSDTGAQFTVPQQIAEGVRGGDADPLTVVTTQVTPGAWALGSKSSVSMDFSMPAGFAYGDIDTSTFSIQGETPPTSFDAQTGRLSVLLADLESRKFLFIGENRLSVAGQLSDGTPFLTTFTIPVTGSVVSDVVGLSHSEADEMVRLAGLVIGDIQEKETEEVPEGQVLTQSLVPADHVPSLTSVDLVIASAVTVSSGSSGNSVSGGGNTGGLHFEGRRFYFSDES